MGSRESGAWMKWFVILGWIKSQIEILPVNLLKALLRSCSQKSRRREICFMNTCILKRCIQSKM